MCARPATGGERPPSATSARAIAAIAARRGVQAESAFTYNAPAATCDARLMDALAAAVARQGLPARRLPSGAGHDGMALHDVFPIAMLFVRCRGGVSHNPAEYASPEDIDVGARVLLDFVEHFDGAVCGLNRRA